MGMTIDKAIAELELLKKNTFSYMSAHQAFITAIDTMKKYRKITVIYQWAKDRSYLIETDDIMDKLKEVVEDGNDSR